MLISWRTVNEFCPDIRGIIHVGAYTAEERYIYGSIPVKWVEADPDLIPILKRKGLEVYHFAATNYRGTARFNLAKFKPASSLLEPNLNAIRRSDTATEKTIEVPAGVIVDIQGTENFINLDIQGAELNALKGCDLDRLPYIYTEVHEVETYHGCTQISELDAFLSDYERVITRMTKHGWGDALYRRR